MDKFLKRLVFLILGIYLGLKLYAFSKKKEKDKVKSLYRIWAGTYDWFIRKWNKWVVSEAESDLNEFLMEQLKTPIEVLDLACGTGQNIDRLESYDVNKYVGVDMSIEMQEKARKKAKGMKDASFVIEDINKYEPKQNFDLIICTWALSHIKDPSALISKYKKHLKKDGYFVLIFQGEMDGKFFLNKCIGLFGKWLQARLIPEEEIEEFSVGSIISEKYIYGYTRLLIFKK